MTLLKVTYTPECGECGIPTDNAKRCDDGTTRCRECCPPEQWQYEVVYADPPWMETGAGKIKRGADRHYPLMQTSEIELLGAYLAAPDSFLFLWATNNHLRDALSVMKQWGFRYVTNLVWVKDRQGLGFYTRGMHEILLLGVRGQPARSRQPSAASRAELEIPPSVVHAPRTRHSEKPEAFRQIVAAYGQPRLEMFARSTSPFFDAWGNEV